MTGLSIGVALNEILQGVAKGAVYPIYADIETPAPFIVYQRAAITEEEGEDKDAGRTDVVELFLICVSESYEGAVAMAEEVRQRMNIRQEKRAGLFFERVELTDAYEEMEKDIFLQGLRYKMRIGINIT